MSELQDYVWLRDQWRRFRHVLVGTLTAVLVLCASGLFLLHDEADPQAWFWARMALSVTLTTSTAVALWLWFKAGREIRDLGQMATEARLEAARQARESKEQKKARRRN